MSELATAAESTAKIYDNAVVPSERLFAERIAKAGVLAREVRWITDGPFAGQCRFTGTHWERCSEPVPRPLAAAVHEQSSLLIRSGLLDPKVARQLESTNGIRGIAKQLEGYAEMQMRDEDLDPPGLLVTPSAVLNLETGERLKHDPARPVTRCTPVDPGDQGNPIWQRIIAHIHSFGADVSEAMQRYLGAGLLGIPPDRRLLWMIGLGDDGKSTYIRALTGALGHYSATIPAETLEPGGARGAHGHELLARLVGARLAVATEVGEDLDWPLIKSITGGDARTTKRLNGRNYTFTPRAALLFASNRRPTVPAGDQAAADRIGMIQWQRPADPDPEVAAALGRPGPERDGVLGAALSWLLAGCAAFQRDGALNVAGVLAPGMASASGVAAWWSTALECGDIRPGEGWTPASALTDAAQTWCRSNGQGLPTATEIGIFLGSRLARKRIPVGDRKVAHYRVTLADGVGRGSKCPPYTCGEDAFNPVQPSPGPSAQPTAPPAWAVPRKVTL